MSHIKAASKYVLAMFMFTAGIMHFANPVFFLKIVPPYLPLHKELVLVSGVCEILLGMLLLVPKCSRMSAWGIVALLIAVFPANLYLYQHQDILPSHWARVLENGLRLSEVTEATRTRTMLG